MLSCFFLFQMLPTWSLYCSSQSYLFIYKRYNIVPDFVMIVKVLTILQRNFLLIVISFAKQQAADTNHIAAFLQCNFIIGTHTHGEGL